MSDIGLKKARGYGLRHDGTPKGTGWLGPLPTHDGGVATEQTFDVDIDGQKHYMPLLVPGHSTEDMNAILSGGKPSKEAFDRAIGHGLRRKKQGLSPYVD